jgi:hypothetical protein
VVLPVVLVAVQVVVLAVVLVVVLAVVLAVVLVVQSTDHLPTQKVTMFTLANRFVTDSNRLMQRLMGPRPQAE